MKPAPVSAPVLPPLDPELSRPICFCTRHLRKLAYASTIASLFLGLSWLVWLALVVGAWSLLLAVQWQAFHRAVRTYRQRGTIFVVHSGEETALTRAQTLVREIQQEASKSSKKCTVILKSSADFEPWILLTGSHCVVFVTGEGVDTPTPAAPSAVLTPSPPDRFLLWLLNDKATRLTTSALTGWNTNIVYTAEGKRRSAFQRVNFAVVPCRCDKEGAHTVASSPREPAFRGLSTEPTIPSLARQVDGYLEAFAARRLCADAVSLVAAATVPLLEGDITPPDAFFEWALSCPCCEQVTVERARQRPSPFRIPFWRQHLLLLTEPSMRGQLWRYYKQYLEGVVAVVKSWELTWTRARIVFLHHMPPPPPPPPVSIFQWNCAFGDSELVDEKALSQLDLAAGSLNPNFVLSEGVGRECPLEVNYEFAASFMGPQLCVTHPRTLAHAVYQITNDEDLKLLQDLPSRKDLVGLTPCQQAWLVESEMWLPPQTAWQAKFETARNELNSRGWTVFDAFSLIPAPLLRALRRHYRCMEPYLFDTVAGPPSQRAYNDEPVARQIQESLTGWVQTITGETLAHSALALSLFIRPGQGFIFHTDTSPPFDITLDVAVDHEGPFTRPLYFTRPNPQGGLVPIAEKLELKFGEAVLFRGSELTHWGGDMGEGSQHKVILGTWQFLKD